MKFLIFWDKKFFIIIILFFWGAVFAPQVEGSEGVVNFFVERSFDPSGRDIVEAILIKTTPRLYFYIEKPAWDFFSLKKKGEILSRLDEAARDFENNIYPRVTSFLGLEWRPGIDKDERITVFFHALNNKEGGYTRTADGYEKIQIPSSNERRMMYLSLDLLDSPLVKVVMAHELVHLITFNQKERNFRVEEETWLNEARAEYIYTFLGYDANFPEVLENRLKDFLENPSDSLTEWNGTKFDYATIFLFVHYLVDHYGEEVLRRSLMSPNVGIESINTALASLGYRDRFSDIFANWTLAVILNDCSLNTKYCYLNKNLKKFKITPIVNFLPFSGKVSLSIGTTLKDWSSTYQRFIGGNGDLELEFLALSAVKYRFLYILEDKSGNYTVANVLPDKENNSRLKIPDFSNKYKALILCPFVENKIKGFNGNEIGYPFTYKITTGKQEGTSQDLLIKQLLEKIEYLKAQIAQLREKRVVSSPSCKQITKNLYFGLFDKEVECLQLFLKSQGSAIYPEGLVTGYFGSLTKQAVIKFQEKYSLEILAPLGLNKGTGYVGTLTRNKINQLLALFP